MRICLYHLLPHNSCAWLTISMVPSWSTASKDCAIDYTVGEVEGRDPWELCWLFTWLVNSNCVVCVAHMTPYIHSNMNGGGVKNCLLVFWAGFSLQ